MYYKMEDIPTRPVGRPKEGAENRSRTLSIRVEPRLNDHLAALCRVLGVTKSQALRQGVLMYIQEMEKRIRT